MYRNYNNKDACTFLVVKIRFDTNFLNFLQRLYSQGLFLTCKREKEKIGSTFKTVSKILFPKDKGERGIIRFNFRKR